MLDILIGTLRFVAGRSRSQWLLLASDMSALFLCLLLGAVLRHFTGGDMFSAIHAPLLIVLFLTPLFNYIEGLYSTVPPALPEELRILGISTTLAYLCLAILFFLGRDSEPLPSRFVFLVSWLVSLALVPLFRCLLRNRFCRADWWGTPAVLMGNAEQAASFSLLLQKYAQSGLRPLAFYGEQGDVAGLTTLRTREALNTFSEEHAAAFAVVLMERNILHDSGHQSLVDRATLTFQSVILVPCSFAQTELPFWIRPLEIGDGVCLKIRQNLLDPRRLALKRCVDFTCAFLGGLCLLPLFAAVALCIRLETPGPVFFRQARIGRGGKIIRVLKFRTMIRNAEEVLQACLDADPELRKEWDADQKLRNDPRITRVGAFLRRTSLDELPQLWNVIVGDMSLVGPRPIVHDEIARYGTSFDVYARVRPGITGLWQVSGRNDLSYAQRVHCDRYYICNWSTWLDVLILARTIPVVLGKKGAY